MSFGTLQTAWAEALLDGLIESGVRRVVVSPGSRSTPIVFAIARAEAAGRLEASVVIDERAAGFFALGQARVTGVPSLCVCTSGSAGAHYMPALVEAAEARIPMLVLTADRPPELRGRGAPQTTEQSGLFGRFVRRAFEIGPAEADPRAVEGLRRTMALSVHATRWPDPGPVHLNAAFRKPLEPEDLAAADLVRPPRHASEPPPAYSALPDLPDLSPGTAAIEIVAGRIASADRGLIVLGPCGPLEAPSGAAVEALAAATGYPVLAEATSQHRFGASRHEPAFDVFEPAFSSAAFRDRAAPELVLQVGGVPTGRALGAWIAASGVERIVLARHAIPEAFNQAARIVIGDLQQTLLDLAGRIEQPPVDAAWAAAVRGTVEQARSLASQVADRPGSQGGAVRAAVEALPEAGQLMVGNSMPVRDVDLYVPSAPLGIRVLAQRGAAGIDGLIAGAAGATAASGRPTVLLLGDVSFQHDLGGLATTTGLQAPLAIVVVANGGGRLFELLPVHARPGVRPIFDRFFLTPPGVSVPEAAAAFGIEMSLARNETELRTILAAALDRPGPTIIEAVVESDGAEAVRRIASELDAWLTGPEGCLPD